MFDRVQYSRFTQWKIAAQKLSVKLSATTDNLVSTSSKLCKYGRLHRRAGCKLQGKLSLQPHKKESPLWAAMSSASRPRPAHLAFARIADDIAVLRFVAKFDTAPLAQALILNLYAARWASLFERTAVGALVTVLDGCATGGGQK